LKYIYWTGYVIRHGVDMLPDCMLHILAVDCS